MLLKTPLSLLLSSLLLLGAMQTTLSAQNTPQQKKSSKPFLIQGKLPHLTMMVKMMWDDADLALTKEQKQKLLRIRKETLSQAKALNKEIIQLEESIVQASNNNVAPKKLKNNVFKLAKLRAQATMVHLKCIYNTRKTLTQEQLDILE
jgi:hypothetical protein